MKYKPDYPKTRKQYLEMLRECMAERDALIAEYYLRISEARDVLKARRRGCVNEAIKILEGK